MWSSSSIISMPLLVLLLLGLLPLSEQADQDDEQQQPSGEDQLKALFQEVDTDSDGGINRAEALAFWREKVKSMEPEELKRRLDKYKAKSLEEAVERGFKQVDKDGDGKVGPEELKQYLSSP